MRIWSESIITNHVIFGLKNSHLQGRLLIGKRVTEKKTTEYCRCAEVSKQQVQEQAVSTSEKGLNLIASLNNERKKNKKFDKRKPD